MVAVDENGAPETPVTQALEKRRNKNLTVAALAVGGIGVAVTVFLRKKSSSTAIPPVSLSGTGGVPSSGLTDSNGNPLDLTGLFSGLQQQIAGIGGSTVPPFDPYAGNKQVGAGFLTPNAPDYAWLGGQSALDSAVQSGATVYFEPAQGVYTPATPALIKRFETPGDPFASTPTYLARQGWTPTASNGPTPAASTPPVTK